MNHFLLFPFSSFKTRIPEAEVKSKEMSCYPSIFGGFLEILNVVTQKVNGA